MIADEELHRHAMENIVQADALLLGRVRNHALMFRTREKGT
jgi:hypothetical protein